MGGTTFIVSHTEKTLMTRVVLESSALSKLSGVWQTAIVCDESGRAIGFFERLDPPTGKGRDGTEPPFSEEQIEQFRQQRHGRALAKVLADLEKLA